uniref:MLO-like protein n=1 Tax=Kalanchoe fedtschenkoi TaxID=63787 RepID=A0A7N0TNM3_KALFE
MAGPAVDERTLEDTATWAVALVCAVFVILSFILEHGLESLAKWFRKRHKKAMTEALEKIKSELMLLGFMSLLLTFGTPYVSKICIPAHAAKVMLPCKKDRSKKSDGGDSYDGQSGRKLLLSYAEDTVWRRFLEEPGKVELISSSGLHQLHIFIFILAVFHVIYSVFIMALSRAKMRKWKSWESETSSLEYQYTNDPSRFRFTHQTSFVRRHTGVSRIPGVRWVIAFFRQFFGSVSKVDYLTMRHGFITAHFAPNVKFDFHRYIKRSMEDDFKVVVGISVPLWAFAVLFMLANVYKLYTYSWLSLAPLVILLMVGTKLELVIMEMAQEIQTQNTVIKGAIVVQPNNKYFWFNRPQWVLLLIHFTLFQNAFQMAYFLWICYEFGITSCFHEKLPLILTRIILGVASQILCSYITFPLYALVTQMGSHMKTSIFKEQTAKAIKKWQKAAKNKTKINKASPGDASVSSSIMSRDSIPSQGASPLHLLGRYKMGDIESAMTSAASYHSDTELSDMGGSSHNQNHHQLEPSIHSQLGGSGHNQMQEASGRVHLHHPHRETIEESGNPDFSFDKP